MPFNDNVKIRIREVIKDSLLPYYNIFALQGETVTRNTPFHDVFLQILQEKYENVDLNTSYLPLVASWANLQQPLSRDLIRIGHILSNGYQRFFKRNFALEVSINQARIIDRIISSLNAGLQYPNVEQENDLIFVKDKVGERTRKAPDIVVDIYRESISFVECIQIRLFPQDYDARGEKQKILYAKAAFKRLYPKKNIKFYVGFPFDPTSDTPTGYNKERFMNYLIEFKKFFSPDEILIASELWDHLSGEKRTMEEVLKIVTETVRDFSKK